MFRVVFFFGFAALLHTSHSAADCQAPQLPLLAGSVRAFIHRALQLRAAAAVLQWLLLIGAVASGSQINLRLDVDTEDISNDRSAASAALGGHGFSEAFPAASQRRQ